MATLAEMSGGGWTADSWLLLAYVGASLGVTFLLILLLHLLGRWLGR